MELILTRQQTIEGGVYGEIEGVTSGRDKHIIGTLENEDFLIPEGRYPLQMTYSPKFGKNRPEICDVPERTGIRIHLGTKPQHSTGCILVSQFGLAAIETAININKRNNEETFITVRAHA